MDNAQFGLEMRDIKFSYKSKGKRESFELIVDDFAPRSCTAVLGSNGSGKTTLGKLAAGILKPNSGRVLYNSEDIAPWKLGQIGKCVGYLFQEPSRQIFAPYPLEEVALPLQLRGMSKDESESRAHKLLAEFELENIIESTTYTLSRGEKQRLAIAAAMVCEPHFFVLDEPTTGLDKRMRKILAKTLQTLMDKGKGILIISHDKEFVEELGADIRFMEGGRLLSEETA